MSILKSISGKHWTNRVMQVMAIGIPVAILGVLTYVAVYGDGNEPPKYIGKDTKAEQVIICQSADSSVVTVESVQSFFRPWTEDCWDTPPTSSDSIIYGHSCKGWANDGELRIHSCREQMPNGEFPCESTTGEMSGRTISKIRNNRVVSADMYLEPEINRKLRTGEHEIGHYLGLTVNVEDPSKRTSLGSHTGAATNLMSRSGYGRNRRWLNRCEGGDWPY